MAEYSIASADLSTIERNLQTIYSNIQTLDESMGTVNNNVKVVYDEIGQLANDFHEYVEMQMKSNRLNQAETKLVKIRQELDKKFGHYDVIRRTTTGILQADDIGIVKKETISNATEELMISTPGYWLAPCLVALAAWINDQPELAERALKEGIRRNDEKTSLFFALICRRAGRSQASLKWTKRYLENQDEEKLDRKSIIILDAYASGLLGADSEGVISRQMTEWLEHLADKPGFVEKQTKQWSEAIDMKRMPLNDNSYTYLKKYSKTWPALKNIMEGANLHAEILTYFTDIFDQESSSEALKVQLDEILTSLVSDFDDEEIPLRKQEKFEQFVVDFGGDEKRARSNMNVEESAFETYKDFTQLLTDSAMKPESSHSSVSTQKFAIALSKEWIKTAYNDLVAKNRMQVPNEIEINIDTFDDKTTDGQNEPELVNKFNSLIDKEKAEQLAFVKLTGYEQFCLFGGAAIGVIGLIMMLAGSFFLGLIAIIAGIGMVINHFSKKGKLKSRRQSINDEYELKRNNGLQILRATLAEIVDFRAEFAQKDSESTLVLDFLEQISPDQYVKKLSDSTRRIRIS